MALIVRLWKSDSPFKHLSNANQKGKIYVITNITTLSFWINKGENYLQRYNYNSLMHSHTFAALNKWKFEFTDLNKILEFIFILIFTKKRRKIYCSWAGGLHLWRTSLFGYFWNSEFKSSYIHSIVDRGNQCTSRKNITFSKIGNTPNRIQNLSGHRH